MCVWKKRRGVGNTIQQWRRYDVALTNVVPEGEPILGKVRRGKNTELAASERVGRRVVGARV